MPEQVDEQSLLKRDISELIAEDGRSGFVVVAYSFVSSSKSPFPSVDMRMAVGGIADFL